MRAMVLDGPGEAFAQRTLPDPVPGPGEAVARVLACGAGLTTQHVKAGRIPASFPRIIGHEITAEIVEAGPAVTWLAPGDGVTAYYYLSCGHCRWCLRGLEPLCEASGGNVGKDCDGGYAELIKLPARHFIKFPASLNYRAHPALVAVIADAVATPYKVLRRAGVRPGETVVVIGAGGGVGLHQVMLARWAHACVIALETAQDKHAACREAGAETVLALSGDEARDAVWELTGGKGADVVIDYVSNRESLETGARMLGRRGRLVSLGGAGETVAVDALKLMLSEQAVLGSRYVSRSDILDTLDLAARGEIWPIVSDIRPLEAADALHSDLEAGAIIGRAAVELGLDD